MDILFRDKHLKEVCNEYRLLRRRYGDPMAKAIRRRLHDLQAASTLETMRTLPGHCHELKGDRAAQISIDLRGQYRLLFTPAHNPLPTKADGGLDWTQVTAARIIEVRDTHE